MSTETEIDLNENLFRHTFHGRVKWSSFAHALLLKQVEEVGGAHSNHQAFKVAHTCTRTHKNSINKSYLFVFILQGNLVLAGTFSFGPLHFLSTTRWCAILQAQHLATAGELKEQKAISPPRWPSKHCSVISVAGYQLCGVRGLWGKQQVESDVQQTWLGARMTKWMCPVLFGPSPSVQFGRVKLYKTWPRQKHSLFLNHYFKKKVKYSGNWWRKRWKKKRSDGIL